MDDLSHAGHPPNILLSLRPQRQDSLRAELSTDISRADTNDLYRCTLVNPTDVSGLDPVEVVTRDGVEPPAPAFSGL